MDEAEQSTALEHSSKLFNALKELGVEIILVATGRENLRSATIDNLVNEGFFGWSNLILRGPEDENKKTETYKAEVRQKLISCGYCIWGNLGHQWSSIEGHSTAKTAFKLPNPLYYVA